MPSLSWPPGSEEATPCPLCSKGREMRQHGWECSGPQRRVCGYCPRSQGQGRCSGLTRRQLAGSWKHLGGPAGLGLGAICWPPHPGHNRPQQGSLPLLHGAQCRGCLCSEQGSLTPCCEAEGDGAESGIRVPCCSLPPLGINDGSSTNHTAWGQHLPSPVRSDGENGGGASTS